MSKTISKEGHRERVKQQIIDNGLSSLQEHQIIEFLLFFGIPYKDTKPIAYELVNRFGNLYAIANSRFESLLDISGMTKNAAMLLTTIPQLLELYIQESSVGSKIKTVMDAMAFLSQLAIGDNEICYLLNLDENSRVISVEKLMSGTNNSLDIPTRTIIKTAMDSNAKKVVVAHNHPSGNVDPSLNDSQNTYALKRMLEVVDIELVDHLIINKNRVFSITSKRSYEMRKE